MALLTLAKAGVQLNALSDLRTAFTLTVCEASAKWSGTVNWRPASTAVKVQAGLPKLQVVALLGVTLKLDAPNTTLPAVVTCTLLVVVLAPAAIVKFAPLGQTTLGVPVAVSVPVRPPV